MGNFVIGNDPCWKKLVESLGLDWGKSRDVTIDLPLDGVATVTSTQLVDGDDGIPEAIEKKFILLEVSDDGVTVNRYTREDPDRTFGLVIEHRLGVYSKAYPNDMLRDPDQRRIIHDALDSVLNELMEMESAECLD